MNKLSHFILFLIAIAIAYFVGPHESKKQLEELQKKYDKAREDSAANSQKAKLYDHANDNAIKFKHHCDSLVKAKADAMEKLNSRSNNTVNN